MLPDITHQNSQSVVFEDLNSKHGTEKKEKVQPNAAKCDEICNFITTLRSLFKTTVKDDETGKTTRLLIWL